MKLKRHFILLIITIVVLTSACAPVTKATEESIDTPTVRVRTNTATQTREPTATQQATQTSTPEPTETLTPKATANPITELIHQGHHEEALELTQQAVADGEFANLHEAILEWWLPVIREQTDYSDTVIERLSPSFSSLEVNENGLAVIKDAEGNVLIEKTAPGTSNVEWAIPIVELAYGLEGEEKDRVSEIFNNISREGMSFSENSNLYDFFVVLDGVTQLEEPLELPNGFKVTTVANFYYYDVKGNLQKIIVPYVSYNREDLTLKLYGAEAGKYETVARFDELLNKALNWQKDNKGPMTIEGHPELEPGEILILGFNLESTPGFATFAGEEYFGEIIKLYHSQESLDAFASDGDPSHLPMTEAGPLLLPILESMGTSLHILQE
jgi:hypothetical protein